MNPLSVLLFAVSGGMLVIALMVYNGETRLIRTIKFVSVKDKKEYERFLAKSIALTSLAFILGGVLCLFMKPGIALIIMLIAVIATLVFNAKKSKVHY